jgi:hypothetical protein
MKPLVSPNAGSIPYKLDSISWRKPGLVEVEVSCYALSDGFTMPADPVAEEYFELEENVKPRLEARRVRNEGTVTRVSWVFRAGREMPDSPTDRQTSDTKSQWGLNVSLMQEPITCHPNLMRIMEVGGGIIKDGEVDFPRMLNGEKNPYYGTRDFLVPGVTMSCETIEPSSNMSFSQIDKLGYSLKGGIEQKPTGKGGADIAFKFVDMSKGEGRKPWLLVEHNVRRAGFEQAESKTWRYGGVAGWADPMYNADYSFGNTSGGGNGGNGVGGGGNQAPLGAV